MKTKLIAALFAVAAATPFAAQAQNVYVGASVGRTELKGTIEGESGKENDTGFKVFGGYQFNQRFGIEGGFASLGKLADSDGTSSASLDPVSVYLAGTATMPVGERFSLFAKAGVASNRTEVRATFGSSSFSSDYSQTAPFIGVGASFAVAKNISLALEYENFGTVLEEDGLKLKASMLSVGARYTF